MCAESIPTSVRNIFKMYFQRFLDDNADLEWIIIDGGDYGC